MTIYLFSAVYLFYSRIIFKKLDDSARILFRKVEKTFKNAAKLRADINFLRFCFDNRLLPKFTNFKLYDVSASEENSTLEFKKSLLLREISKKELELEFQNKESISSYLQITKEYLRPPFLFFRSIY